MSSPSRKERLRFTTLASALVLALSTFAPAQTTYVYGMNETGRIVINDTSFHNLPSKFDPNEPPGFQEVQDQWYDQAISGSQHYHLRRDGNVYLNGARLFRNPEETDNWFRIALDGSGGVYCLDFTGLITFGGQLVYDLPIVVAESRIYQDFQYASGVIYSLRTDGEVYAGQTKVHDLPGDAGATNDPTRFIKCAFDPTASERVMYAIRLDGTIYSVELSGANAGTEAVVATLPSTTLDEQWVDIQFDAMGDWYALREDGLVVKRDTITPPWSQVADYPGDGTGDSFFLSMSVFGTDVYAIRFDGKVYRNSSLVELWDYQSTRYRRVFATDVPPDTSNLKPTKPVVAVYKTELYVGDTAIIPVIASDIDDATLTIGNPVTPSGATWDGMANAWTFTPTLAGSFTFEIDVADSRQSKTYKYKAKVKDKDLDPAKNKGAKFQKIKKVQIFRSEPFSVRIEAFDIDQGDMLTYTTGTLPVWVNWDPMTLTFSGTVPNDVEGKFKLDVFATDVAGKRAKGKVQLVVESAFHF